MTEKNYLEKYWDKMKDPPGIALKPITGGRLKGKTDISPQWRLMIMTEVFGPIGEGWNYIPVERWTESCGDEVACFVRIELVYRKEDGEMSLPISGTGGSMLFSKEKNGYFLSDEAYKMATTDALSVAMKQLGIAANVYLGQTPGNNTGNGFVGSDSKYQNQPTKIKMATIAQIKELDEILENWEKANVPHAGWLKEQINSGLSFEHAEITLVKAKNFNKEGR